MSAPLWRLDEITLSGNDRPRLDGVSCEIPPGVTAVIGYSGAGKTSLLNLLVGFERPERGQVTRIYDDPGDRLPLFWVPQEDGLWPHETAAEHLQIMAAGAEDAAERVENLLSAFDLLDKSAAYPDLMSQGERARLSVARALASRAAVLVMDEPLVHVDPAREEKYWRAIRNHLSDTNTSLVIATHSPETVLREAQHALCLKSGRLLHQGPVDNLYYDPQTPEMAEFLGAANWLPRHEAQQWCIDSQRESPCFRPEQIKIRPVEQSPLVVQLAHFSGSLEEVELLNEDSQQRRTFFHRPAGNALRRGIRVAIHVCLLLLACGMSLGCDQDDEPQLYVSEVNHWMAPPMGARIPRPRGLAIGDNDEVLCLDNGGRLLVFDEHGKLLRQWEMPDHAIGKPEGVCLLTDGRIAVADTHYHRVVFFDEIGNVLSYLGGEGQEDGQFLFPVALCQDESEHTYVCEYGGDHRVQKFTASGEHLLTFGTFGTDDGQFQRPSGIVWDDGRLYIADAINNRVQVFTDTGKFVEVLGETTGGLVLEYPYDITLDRATSDLYIIEYGAGRVTKTNLAGKLLGRFGKTSRNNDGFLKPWGLAIDTHQRLRVADTENHRIVELKL